MTVNAHATATTRTQREAATAATILINRNLFSHYYLGTLFERDVQSRIGETGKRMPEKVRRSLQAHWDRHALTLGSTSSYSRTRDAWLDPLLLALGYEHLPEARPQDFKEQTLPPGYLLYQPPPHALQTPSSSQSQSGTLPHQQISSPDNPFAPADDENDDSETEEEITGDHAVLISLLAWGIDFDRPFPTRERRSETPHKLMERLLASGGPARWGILCNGRRIRLLRRDLVAGRQHYYEIDLETLFDNSSERDIELKERAFSMLWALFHAQAFRPGADGRCLLDVLESESRSHAEGVSTHLKSSVFRALEELMSMLVKRAFEFSSHEPAPGDENARRRHAAAQQALNDLPLLYRQSLVFLYRLLFVLYAESRELLPLGSSVYDRSYSLQILRDELENRLPDVRVHYRPDSLRLWETLQALFRLIHRGCNTSQLIVPAYNGYLFDPRSTSLLNALQVPDPTIATILVYLMFTPPTKERGRETINYRDLGVEQLGAVYEGLLEFEPRIATEPMVEVRYKGSLIVIPAREQRDYQAERNIAAGEFYLGYGAGRKTTGSYYTPQPLVDFLVRRTLEPLVQGKSSEEILQLKVVDPAMGSGAFLVGACLFLTDAYARARQREEMPAIENGTLAIPELSEEETRPYRRIVAERCLYGVDLNEMAVELARVSLWLTTLAGDKPLTFLDANLRCGNSLIGAPLHLAGHGQENIYTIYTIHPEAARRLARARGDNLSAHGQKSRRSDLWGREPEESEARQHTLDEELADVRQTMPALVDQRDWIAALPSDTVANVHEKATVFQRRVLDNRRRRMLEQICNLWVATWFWRQPPASHTARTSHAPADPASAERDWSPPLDGPIYAGLVSYIRSHFGEGAPPLIKFDPRPYLAEVERITRIVRPLHWQLEFPEVFFEPDGRPRANPGFDAILGNPPWDIVKTNSREFFSVYDPAFRELERVEAEKRQQELLKEPAIAQAWTEYTHDIEGLVDFARLSDLYPYQRTAIDGRQTGGGDNTYKLFLERAYSLLRQGGESGLIVPSGLYTDQGSTGLRRLFLNRAQISYLFCFENRKGIFPIDSRFKFVLFGARKAEGVGSFDAAFMLHHLHTLAAPREHALSIPSTLISRFSPDTLSIMEFRSQRDVDIVARIYDNHPPLGEDVAGAWSVPFAHEFNMTNDRPLFNQEQKGWPLYEGKTIHQYTHRFSAPRYWVEPAKGCEELARKEMQRVEEQLDALAIKRSRLRHAGTRQERIRDLLKHNGRGPLSADDVRIAPEAPRLAFRDIARNTDERTVISAILPPHVFVGHLINLVNPWHFDAQQALANLHDIRSAYRPSLPAPIMLYLCGVFNSFIIDYVLRFKVSMHVSMFYVYQLPVPRLTLEDPHCRAIARRVAQLVCVGPEFDELRRELLGGVDAHVAVNPIERQHLQSEIDALVAQLYGLHEDDLRHILYAPYTFPLVNPAIKDGVMAAFARLAENTHSL